MTRERGDAFMNIRGHPEKTECARREHIKIKRLGGINNEYERH